MVRNKSMVGESVKGNVTARVENTKTNVKGVMGDLKEIFGDVKERIVNGTEPQFCKKYPGPITGRTGSLAADVAVLPFALIDHIEDQIQGFAQINRRWLGNIGRR